MSNIKTINGLMKYLRNNHNIKINGSTDKQKLKCVGYYHGYKGYRYIKKPNNRINFSSFDVKRSTTSGTISKSFVIVS